MNRSELRAIASDINTNQYQAAQNDRQLTADATPRLVGLGDRDPDSGKTILLYPNGGTAAVGVPTFNGSAPVGTLLSASQSPGSSTVAISGRNADPLPQTPPPEEKPGDIKILYGIYTLAGTPPYPLDLWIVAGRQAPQFVKQVRDDPGSVGGNYRLNNLGKAATNWRVDYGYYDGSASHQGSVSPVTGSSWEAVNPPFLSVPAGYGFFEFAGSTGSAAYYQGSYYQADAQTLFVLPPDHAIPWLPGWSFPSVLLINQQLNQAIIKASGNYYLYSDGLLPLTNSTADLDQIFDATNAYADLTFVGSKLYKTRALEPFLTTSGKVEITTYQIQVDRLVQTSKIQRTMRSLNNPAIQLLLLSYHP